METDNAQNQNNAPASVNVNQPATQPEQALGEPAAQPIGEAAPEAMEQQQNKENPAKRKRIISETVLLQDKVSQTLQDRMNQVIRIKMFEKVKNLIPYQDIITKSSVRSAFLLSDDAIVSLSYMVDGVEIVCETRNTPEPCFLLPNDWRNIEFLLESNNVLSRPALPLDIQDEPPIVDRCRDYMLYSKISETTPGVFGDGPIKSCVTVATSQFAFMAGHCLPKGLPENETFQVYSRKDEIFDVRLVKRYDEDGDDFGIIEIQNGSFPHYPPATTLPESGVSYFILGYDAEHPSVDRLSCFKGTFRNTQIYLNRNYVIGSPGTTSGCSGAGVFCRFGTLYGICVSTLQTKLSEPSYSHIIPACSLFALIPDRKRKREEAED